MRTIQIFYKDKPILFSRTGENEWTCDNSAWDDVLPMNDSEICYLAQNYIKGVL